MDVIYLRGLAILAGSLGKPEVATAFNALAAARQAGRNIDDRMAEVAATLEAGGEPDWAGVTDRINSETEEFLAR